MKELFAPDSAGGEGKSSSRERQQRGAGPVSVGKVGKVD